MIMPGITLGYYILSQPLFMASLYFVLSFEMNVHGVFFLFQTSRGDGDSHINHHSDGIQFLTSWIGNLRHPGEN